MATDVHHQKVAEMCHMLVSGDLVDVVLVCRDGVVPAHKAMLAATGPSWRYLLEEVHLMTGGERLTVLLPDLGVAEVTDIVRFTYTGRLNIRQEDKVEQVKALVKVLLPDFKLNVVSWLGGVILDASTEKIWREKACSKVVVKVEEGVEDNGDVENDKYNKTDVSETITKWTAKTNDVLEAPKLEIDMEVEDDLNEDMEHILDDDNSNSSLKENDDPSQSGTSLFSPLAKNWKIKKKDDDEKTCSHCSKQFLYPKDLKKHLLIHTKVLPFGCNLCKKYVRTLSNIYKHLREKHQLKEDLKKYVINEKGEPYVHENDVIRKEIKEGTIDVSLLNYKSVIDRGSVGLNSRGMELFKCLVCSKHIAKTSLRNHLNFHGMNKVFKCEECDKEFSTNSAMRNHQKRDHSRVKSEDTLNKIKCSFCPKSFNSQIVVQHHQLSCEGKNKDKIGQYFECKICNKIFGYKPNLLIHQKTVHGITEGRTLKNLPCKYCKEIFRGKIRLSKHITAMHQDASGELCDLCGKSFQTEEKLIRHTAIHTTRVREFQCSFCPKKFFRKDVLHVHEKVHTNPLICSECGKKFPEKRYLEAHRQKVHSIKKYDCLYCLKGYSTPELLRKHIKNHNRTLDHQCDYCDKRFKTKSEYKRHLLQHTPGDTPLKCEVCHKGFMTESLLQRHMDKIHTKPSKLLMYCQHCELVNKVTTEFDAIYNLKRHLVKHKCNLMVHNQSEQPLFSDCDICVNDPETYFKLKKHIKDNQDKRTLPCGMCNRKFKTLQELTVHTVVHTGQKPFSCELCGEKFTQKCSLKTHYNRHKAGTVGTRQFLCSICGKVCKTFSALQAHKKSHQCLQAVNNKNILAKDVSREAPEAAVKSNTLMLAGHHPYKTNLMDKSLQEKSSQLIFQDKLETSLLSLDPDGAQFQVTTINIEGFEGAGLDYRPDSLITIDSAQIPGLSRFGGHDGMVARLEGHDGMVARLEGHNGMVARLEGHDSMVARLEGTDGMVARLEGHDSMVARLEGHNGMVARLEGTDGMVARLESHDGMVARLEGHDGMVARLEGHDGMVKMENGMIVNSPLVANVHNEMVGEGDGMTYRIQIIDDLQNQMS